jgi:hypothetical protein
LGGELIVLSGSEKGKELAAKAIEGDLIILGTTDPAVASQLKVGHEVQIDNANYLAAQTYHRHQVPGYGYTVWDQFKNESGQPIYPQRPMLIGPLFTQATVGSLPNGVFNGKMILLGSLWDTEAYPWQSDWYRARVTEQLGDAIGDNFRLWFTDHANHADFPNPGDPTHIVSYLGVVQQALLDLSDWVEKGITPPATTNYTIEDGQVIMPTTANERKGIQPIIDLQSNHGKRADVSVGETVTFTAGIEVPDNTGKIVSVAWDFEGTGEFSIIEELEETSNKKVSISRTFSYSKPGTYFVSLRAVSQRNGDVETAFTRIQNLDRVRVVVR